MLYFLIKQGVGECRAFPQVFHLTPFLAFTIIFPLFSALMLFCFIPHTSVSLSTLLSFSICLCLPSNHLSFLSYYMSLPFHSHVLSVSSTLFLPVRGSGLQHNRLISQENVNPTETREGGDMCSRKDRVIQSEEKAERGRKP